MLDLRKVLGVPIPFALVIRSGEMPREQLTVCGEAIPVSSLCEQ